MKKVLFWGGYLLFILLIIEISLRGIFAVPQLQTQLIVNDSYSWQRQWIGRHQENQNDVFYSFDRYHPTLGWISQPNLREIRVFGNKILNTNIQGLRGTTDFSYENKAGKIRILILGDSFTFGDEVSDNETYSYYLQMMLPQAEVINMGVHGYGHDQMLLLFLEEGIKYKPDIVILGFVAEDMERNMLGFRDFAKPQFVVRDEKLVLTHSPVPAPETVLQRDWMRPRILDALSIIQVGAQTKSGQRQIEQEKVTSLIFDQWVEAVAYVNATPVLAYLPAGDELISNEALTVGESFLFSYCETNPEVYCFSARPHFFENVQKGLTVASAFHWDPSGHQTVAEAIFDFLVNQNKWVIP